MRAMGIILSVLIWSSLAAAEPAPQDDLHYRFDDELVVGTSEDPLLDWLQVRRGHQTGSLIEVKTSLVPELLKSVEDW